MSVLRWLGGPVLQSQVFTNRRVGPDSGANCGGHGLHRPSGAGRVPSDGKAQAQGRGPLPARQAGAHLAAAPAGQHVENSP